MPDYKKMYFILFAALSETIEQLQTIQREAEELYMSSPDPPVAVINKSNPAASDQKPREQLE